MAEAVNPFIHVIVCALGGAIAWGLLCVLCGWLGDLWRWLDSSPNLSDEEYAALRQKRWEEDLAAWRAERQP